MLFRIPSWLRIIIMLCIVWGAAEYFIDSGDRPAVIAYPEVALFLSMVLLILISVEMVLYAIERLMLRTMTEEAQERYWAEKNKSFQWRFGQRIYRALTRSRSIQEEETIVMDHDYDGIRELDNVLPPWWVYLFYATIVFGAVYLIRFHVVREYSQTEEFEMEMARAEKEIEEYKKNSKNLVDASTVELLTDASDLKAGEAIFESKCVACHMADGGGGIGPNLTDEYWILGGGIKNVFKTVAEGGRDGKGMVPWNTSLSPLEIAQVSSYVLGFQGTTPANPKDPEGELYVDPNAPAPASEQEQPTDSLDVAIR